MTEVRIEALSPAQVPLWSALREELWPDTSAAEHARESAHLLQSPDYLVLLAFAAGARTDDHAHAQPAGFAEVTLRRSYVNGCDTLPGEPVAFLEGIYVRPAFRRRGVARALVDRSAAWARARGVTEFASDALIDNEASHAMHRALGFEETERIVFFRRLVK